MKLDSFLNDRKDLRHGFLAGQGLSDCTLVPVGEDMAMRRYFRLCRDQRSFILMESIPDDHPDATPGHKIGDFLRIAAWLRGKGLHAPKVYAADEKNGYVLIEDMGDMNFRHALDSGTERQKLYELGADVLVKLSSVKDVEISLPRYEDSHVHKGRRRVVDWFMPCVSGHKNLDSIAEEYLSVWSEIEKKLPPCPRGFLHIDFHLENLMWLPKKIGIARCGVLDFQGAMTGPLPYDLANFLEDARVAVPIDLRRGMMDRFCAGYDGDAQVFRAWYRVLATQFHCRVAGQFIKLALVMGKPRYLAFLPVVAGYLREGLDDPVLAPLKQWFGSYNIDFSVIPAINEGSKTLIRDDAF